ncbi:MAG: uracil-DNA glycosylase [Deltaproteobacteria bacterium]|jgi:uracil-DNA glycosylase family 4|nr:uracil-DNA glycosylase [Deltaproteobacteria bacterium]
MLRDYWNRPVGGFGDPQSRFALVGLAPGAHGANRTGRPFTGDGAGDFMYPLLYQAGFTNQPEAYAMGDGLQLYDLYITNAVKCLPPQNCPSSDEFTQCRDYLAAEFSLLDNLQIIIALGRGAFMSTLHLYKVQGAIQRLADYPFSHGGEYRLPDGRVLLGCYHTSRYNLQTGRMTKQMFIDLLEKAKALLAE